MIFVKNLTIEVNSVEYGTMATHDPTNSDSTAIEEQLVAYLDGELDEQSSRRIEELLAADPTVRQKLEQLDRTWELLDELGQSPVDRDFTETTLEKVAGAAEEDVERGRAEIPRRRRRRWLIAGGGLLASGLAGFLTVTLFWPNPNRQLLRDLPVLGSLDQYNQIDDVEFLRLLRGEGLFAKASAVETRFAKGRIENMTPDEKHELARRWDRFAALEPDEQERLRQLHHQIERALHAAELRQVMQHYYEWLKTLQPYIRAELLDMPPAKRVERIKGIQVKQRLEQVKRLGPDDAKALFQWMEATATRYEPQILKALPEQQRQRLAKLNGPAYRRAIMEALWTRWQSAKPGGSLPIPEQDLVDLRSKLSPATRRNLESLPTAEQWQIVVGWVRQLARHQVTGRRPGRSAPSMSEEKLTHFFEHELTSKQRDRLLGLPAEQMQQELGRLYVAHLRGSEGLPRRPGDLLRAKPRLFDPRHGPPPRSRRGFPPDFRPPQRQ